MILPWSLAPVPSPDAVFVTHPTDGGVVIGTGSHLSALDAEFDRLNRISLLAVLGMALVYTAIAIANTQVMATSGRRRELAALRLAGATRGQLLRLVAREAVTVSAIGTLLGGLVTAATLLTVRVALHLLSDSVTIRIPWPALLIVTASCASIALIAGMWPAVPATRISPQWTMGGRVR